MQEETNGLMRFVRDLWAVSPIFMPQKEGTTNAAIRNLLEKEVLLRLKELRVKQAPNRISHCKDKPFSSTEILSLYESEGGCSTKNIPLSKKFLIILVLILSFYVLAVLQISLYLGRPPTST